MLVWQTEAYRRLAEPLSDALGGPTAKLFAGLGITTVGDLLRHIPRAYLKGTELTDLRSLRPGEQVAVTARVEATKQRWPKGMPPPGGRGRNAAMGRLEAELSDGSGGR
ncbi:MAG: ATP-dependent DNA helicase RecG, partial [Propionibacteriaceae bacterium]|nr:ATP-dependent DNA helicase RecG [Propionibacteriaceae bacterium]